MSDRYDELIGDALGEFRAAEAVSGGPVTGVAAVYATVAHRSKVRITTFGVLGALLIAAPIAAFAANPRGNNPPPVPGDTGTPTAVETVSPTPMWSWPDGRITIEQLTAAEVDVPSWAQGADCQSGKVKLTTQDKNKPGTAEAHEVVYANLDSDPVLETAALLLCRSGDPSPLQVVAFDRDADGKIITLGRIFGTNDDVSVIRKLTARPAGPDGGVWAEVCIRCGSDPAEEDFQRRDYAWNGTKFAQVSGPTTSINQLEVTATKLVLTLAGGQRTGTMTVTVKNVSSTASAGLRIILTSSNDGSHTLAPVTWVGVHGDEVGQFHDSLAPGKSASVTVTITAPANAQAETGQAMLLLQGTGVLKQRAIFQITLG